MKRFIYTIIDIILKIIISGLVLAALLFITSCSTVQPGEKTASYQQTVTEIDDIIKHGDNLTPVQKIVLKHAAADLKDAQAAGKQTAKLQEKLISASEKAGAGKLIYYIMYFVAFLVAAFMGFKILKKFSIF